MNKEEVLNGLSAFKNRLVTEVVQSFEERGSSFGNDRFATWKRKFIQFLNDNLSGEEAKFNNKLIRIGMVFHRGESDAQYFWREYGDSVVSYIDSLMLDIENDEYDFPVNELEKKEIAVKAEIDFESVFIVHGHAEAEKERTARFVEKLGFKAVILHEQPNKSMTIIEKLEKHTNVGFAIVLYTPDDLGNSKVKAEGVDAKFNPRARQNVVLEHGFLMGKIGRDKVVPLVVGDIELPNDISGMVYISDKDWQLDIAKEMKAAGFNIDFNKLM